MAFISSLALRSQHHISATISTTYKTAVPHQRSQFSLSRTSTFVGARLSQQAQQRYFRPSNSVKMVKEGEKAPDFTAQDLDGNTISLQDFKGSKLVLYFSNFSGAGCTKQSCSFRDAEARFQSLDAKLVAVSAQGVGASKAFKQANNLEFPVISDKDGTLQKLFDVPFTLGFIPGRMTYVIDREGIVRSVYNSQISFGSHIDVAKEVLEKIN